MRLLDSGKDYSNIHNRDSINSCKLIKADMAYLQKQYYFETRLLGLNTGSTIC